MKNLYLVLGFVFSISMGLTADYTISEDKYNEIKLKVSTLDESGLKTREAALITEINQLNEEQDNTQSPSKKKQNSVRLALLLAELSEVQKALVAIAGALIIDNSGSDSSFTDITPPSIGIIGDNPLTIELGTAYVDAGAFAIDAVDALVQVTSSGSVNTNVVGSYTITYTASDRSGNSASATRTVNVVDTTAPVVTVTGDNPATVELGASYTDAGATATDASGTVTVVTTGTVDTDTVGTYTITYTSTDASDNVGTATRTVNVVDTTAPVFTSSANFTAAENQTAIGTVTATDITSITFTVSGTELAITSAGVLTFVTAPDYETKSSYTATVTATDANSNTATQDITVTVTNDESDDDTGTSTGTGTSTSTSTGT